MQEYFKDFVGTGNYAKCFQHVQSRPNSTSPRIRAILYTNDSLRSPSSAARRRR